MTPQQAKAFAFIRDEITAVGISPSYDEIGRYMGLTTKSGVHRIVDRLVIDGKLVKAKGIRARNLRLPDHIDLAIVPTILLQEELQRRGAALGAFGTRSVPLLGKIGATCAYDHCGEGVKVGQMFCRGHWYMIPQDVREGMLTAHKRGDLDSFSMLMVRADDAIALGGRN